MILRNDNGIKGESVSLQRQMQRLQKRSSARRQSSRGSWHKTRRPPRRWRCTWILRSRRPAIWRQVCHVDGIRYTRPVCCLHSQCTARPSVRDKQTWIIVGAVHEGLCTRILSGCNSAHHRKCHLRLQHVLSWRRRSNGRRSWSSSWRRKARRRRKPGLRRGLLNRRPASCGTTSHRQPR